MAPTPAPAPATTRASQRPRARTPTVTRDRSRSQAPTEAAPPGAAAIRVGSELGQDPRLQRFRQRLQPPALGLLMPEPPTSPSAAEQSRLEGIQTRASATATAQAALPAARLQVEAARKAVSPPLAERKARAQGELAEELGQQPEPSPEIEALARRIRKAIRDRRPPDEDSLVQAQPDDMARAAGAGIGEGIQSEVDRVEDAYGGLQHSPTPAPAGSREALPAAPQPTASLPIQAQQATPDPVPAASTSLDADVEAQRRRMDEAGMQTEPARLVRTGPIAEARQAQGELEQVAQNEPASLQTRERTLLEDAQAGMVRLQEAALEALRTSRAQTTTGTRAHQERMVGSEEQLRAQASAQAQALFEQTQQRVEALLQPLTDAAMRRWDTGIQRLSNEFKARLSRVAQWIDERHSGVLGSTVVAGADALFGLPSWVTEEYERAEETFSEGAVALARDISRDVQGVIATCEALIQHARTGIAQVFSQLPESLQSWAAREQALFGQRLDGLRDGARQQRDRFHQQLIDQASQAVQQVRQEIHGLRQEAGGLVGRITEALSAFLRDPVRFIIEGLLALVNIPPAAFWSVVTRIRQALAGIARDPLGFASNLLQAAKKGFQLFFTNIGDHLRRGLLDWLFAGLASTGVQLPADLSLRSTTTFFLQLMGITWERIRRLIARRIGERNMALLERAWEFVSTLVRQGPAGVFELIKDRLDPRRILDQVLTAARDALMEMVITRVAARLLLLFNPVGAIVQAIEAIYRVLKWLFENAARLFSLVETVVTGITDILRGNITGMATAVEQALARLISPVIAFLADYLGLGGLPGRIRGVIERMQAWVERLLDQAIGWIAQQVQRLAGSVRTAVGRVFQWWRQRKRFQARDGEVHSLSFQGEGRRARLMVESTPQPFEHFITGKNPTLPVEQRAKQQALALAQELDALITSTGPDGSMPQAAQQRFEALWNQLAEHVSILLGSAGASSGPQYGGLTALGYGASMLVLRLTRQRTGGSEPSVSNPAWELLNLRRNGNGSYYIRGHLLNHHLQGPGDTWGNLTPLSRRGNNAHHDQVEHDVKHAVLEEGKTVRYEVIARYGRRLQRALLAELEGMPPSALRDNTHKVIEAEQHIPSSLLVRAVEVTPDGEPKASPRPNLTREIQNPVEDGSLNQYQVVGQPARRLVLLAINDSIEKARSGSDAQRAEHRHALMSLRGIGEGRVERLIQNGPYQNWDQIWQRNSGITLQHVSHWQTVGTEDGARVELAQTTRFT
jgi:hypothetical protein